jgi:hypothetical protein
LLLLATAVQAGRARNPPAIPFGAAPTAVTSFCTERAVRHTFPTLCPTRYPRIVSSQISASGSSLLAPSFYWASFNDPTGFTSDDDGHLIFGGQRPPFSLVGSHAQTWPRPGEPRPVAQLGLPRLVTTPMQGGGRYVAQRPAQILRHATVDAHVALILVAPPYPDGGFMGGHVIILWNQQHHGYMLSFHFAAAPSGRAYTLDARVAAAVEMARSFTVTSTR